MRLSVPLLTLLCAAPAQAATIERRSERVYPCPVKCGHFDVSIVEVKGDPVEPEVLELGADLGVVRLSSAGRDVTAGPGCEAEDPRTARCGQTPGDLSAFVRLGEGADRARIFAGALWGGGGADDLASGGGTVDGGAGDDLIAATAGRVSVQGGLGADRVTGSAQDDRIDGGPGSDDLDGRAGRDTVTWGLVPEPVTVDLARPDLAAGPASAPDLVRNFEEVGGGSGPDVLRGSEAADVLRGFDGDDVLEGRGGDDVLEGYEGDDVMAGGEGADEITALHGDRVDGGGGDDQIRIIAPLEVTPVCGPGIDTVRLYDGFVFVVPADCERVGDTLGSASFRVRPAIAPRSIDLRAYGAPCLAPCRLAVVLRDAVRRRVVARRTVSVTADRFPAGTAGTRIRLPVRCVPRRLSIAVSDPRFPHSSTTAWQTTLRPHRKRACR